MVEVFDLHQAEHKTYECIKRTNKNIDSTCAYRGVEQW